MTMEQPLKLSPIGAIVDEAFAALRTATACLQNCKTALEGRAESIVELKEELRVANLHVDAMRKGLLEILDGCFCNGDNGEFPDCVRCKTARKGLQGPKKRV